MGSPRTLCRVPRRVWSVESGDKLTPTTPVTLVWDNGAGLVFRQVVSVDANYMFTVAQSVENNTGAEVRLAPYGIIARHGMPPDLKNFYILHEGVILVADGELEETKYKALRDLDPDPAEGGAAAQRVEVAENGWIGFTDHYWMSTLVAQPRQAFTAVSKYTAASDTFQTDMRLPVMSVPAGGTAQAETWLFAGAKVWSLLRDYQDDKQIDRFVDAIDWGWFFFLTKPMFRVLHWMHGLIGNMGLAIIGLTFVIKLILFPLAYKSYASMSKMKALQPEMEKIKERVGDDRMKMQQEMMALYKREKVNPAAGCLPILLQIPIFFALYKVIFVTIDLRHAPFFGWIRDLSAPGPDLAGSTSSACCPGGRPGTRTILGIISIGVWPIVLGVSMWLQQKLNPTPTDKTQAMIFTWMPWLFMFMLGSFASRPGDLLGGEQHHHLRPAVHDHAPPGREAEGAVEHPRAAEAPAQGRLSAGPRRSALAPPDQGPRRRAGGRGDARPRRDDALGPGLGDRPRRRQGRARQRRLGALRQLQPRREVARADGDPRPRRRGRRHRVTLTHPRREPITVDPDDPADAARLIAWVTPLADPDRAAPGLRRARPRRDDRQRLIRRSRS